MRTLLSWSSGKDCAWALHLLRSTSGVEVGALLTTLNRAFDRVAMHAVRRTLLERQAEAAGLPLRIVPLPWPCPNEEYERLMRSACERAVNDGFRAVAFGDLFLEDVRDYRIRQLSGSGLTPLFPVWGQDTRKLARTMIDAGVRAVVTCIDPAKLPREFAGRTWDEKFVNDLPAGVDPCGENGEFHTFVYASPAFDREIAVEAGEVVERDGFVFADVKARV